MPMNGASQRCCHEKTTDDKKEKFAFFKLIETYIKTAPVCIGAVAF